MPSSAQGGPTADGNTADLGTAHPTRMDFRKHLRTMGVPPIGKGEVGGISGEKSSSVGKPAMERMEATAR
eukprot:8004293-Pyramimonas_sp.AAC.1